MSRRPARRPVVRPNPLFFQNRTLSATSGSGGGGSTAAVEVSIATLKTRVIALESIKALEFEE